MKNKITKLFIIICFACKAQDHYCDSSIAEIQSDFKQIKKNIEIAKSLHNTGTMLHISGLWFQVIAITGYSQEYYDYKTYKKCVTYSLILNAIGYCYHLRSHKYVKKTFLEINPNSIKIKF